MRFIRFSILLCISIFLVFSCDFKNGSTSDGLKPKAKGAPGEVVLVVDSMTYEGVVGDEIKSTFQSQVEYLSRPEAYFTVRVVKPELLNSVLRTSKNLIYVTIINDNSRSNRILKSNFTKETVNLIEKDPSIFKYTKQNEFARGQEVMHLFSTDEETLARHIAENKKELRAHFNKLEDERTKERLYSAKREKGIENFILRNYDCEIMLPAGYEIAIKDENFVWARILDPFVDRNIFISYTDYTSQEQFTKESMIQYRDSVSKQHIFGDPENQDSFMVTELEHFPVFYEEVNFNGKYAVQLRGMWKTNNLSMGGAFVSYGIVDEKMNRFYYIEGFLYSPGRKQKEYLRELDVVLQTFQTSKQGS